MSSQLASSLYFYDLETSGFNPRAARIMQFAGQRVDLDLRPLGEPHNILIKLPEDVLPDPDAIIVTGITPQKTNEEGLSEAEFLKIFESEIAVPGTIFVGFNSVRFDDEFMRYMLYRNFYDAYEWTWKDDRSRWDMLDVVRMTRALRPEGIEWPFASDGRPSNKLEDLTKVNNLDHSNAHDALSDVTATLSVARLIRDKQPKLFNYLLEMRRKDDVAKLVESGKPIIYTSGKYSSEHLKTTVVGFVGKHPDAGAALVLDLRHDPSDVLQMTTSEIVEAWKWHPKGYEGPNLPIKTMKYNRCPSIAPLSVLDDSSAKRLEIGMDKINTNFEILNKHKDQILEALTKALAVMNKEQQAELFAQTTDVEAKLYDSFIGNEDRRLMVEMRQSEPSEFTSYIAKFKDKRLPELAKLYKARNFKKSLSDDELKEWELHCQNKLLSGGETSKLASYFERIQQIRQLPTTTAKQASLLTDLELYGQSLLPSDVL